MNQKTDKLHELIQSMSMSEKRAFKLFANRHTIGDQNNYLILFETIEQMSNFDQEAVERSLQAAQMPTRHISSDKNYLYNLILRGLSVFNSNKTTSLKVKELLHQAEVLYEKGLYEHVLGLLKKAKTNALRYELYPLFIEISFWERKTRGKLGDIRGVKQALDEAMHYMALLDNMQAYMKLYYDISDLRRTISKARSAKTEARLATFIQHPFLQRDDIPMSFQAELNYRRIYAMYYYLVDDEENEMKTNEALLSLMSSHDDYATEFPGEYITVSSRLLILKRHKSETEFQHTLDDFRRFPFDKMKKKRNSVIAQVEIDSTATEMSRLLERGRIEESQVMLSSMKELAQRHKSRMSRSQRLSYHYMYTYSYLAAGEYRVALKEVNYLLNEFDASLRPQMYSFARMLNMVIHAELGNLTVLKYEADSTARYLKKRGKLHRLETILIRMFRRLARSSMATVDVRVKHKLYRSFREELNEIYSDEYENKTLIFFDFRAWLDSKVDGVSFGEAKKTLLLEEVEI